MDNKPKRSFRPDPVPRRADGLKDRMRSSTPSRPQPSTPRRTTPPSGEFVPPKPAYPEPHHQDHASDQLRHPQLDTPEPEDTSTGLKMPEIAMPAFLKEIWPRSRQLASRVRLPKLPSISKKVVIRSGIALTGVIVITLVGAGAYYMQEVKARKNPVIPVALTKQTGYEVLYPANNTAAKVDNKTFQFDEKDKLLSYIGYTPSNTKLVISQQALPPSLKAGQPAYDLLISRMLGYKTFKTEIGNVTLTRPTQFKGDQFAILRTKDSLLFIRPAKDISDEQWKELFNSFKPVNNQNDTAS